MPHSRKTGPRRLLYATTFILLSIALHTAAHAGDLNRALSPLTIAPAAEQRVDPFVGRRDRIEHPAHALRLVRLRVHRFQPTSIPHGLVGIDLIVRLILNRHRHPEGIPPKGQPIVFPRQINRQHAFQPL